MSKTQSKVVSHDRPSPSMEATPSTSAGDMDMLSSWGNSSMVDMMKGGGFLPGREVGSTPPPVSPGHEVEADRIAASVASGASAQGLSVNLAASGSAIQCSPIDEARSQHEKRGQDTPSTEPDATYASFNDETEAPEIRHDHGFLDDGSGNIDESKRQDPTWGDRFARLKWIAKLEAAEALRPDLVDGTTAYRHFLFGNGATRPFDYERFIEGDSSGAKVVSSALEDTERAVVNKHDSLIAGSPPRPGKTSFRLQTEPVNVGSDGRYPYPATENWQKAIGGHSIWIEANVEVDVQETGTSQGSEPRDAGLPAGVGEGGADTGAETCPVESTPSYLRVFSVEMILHVEDMYNFNPGAADIATGTPDADNGRFEITGLGHEFLQTSSVSRTLDFEMDMTPVGTGPLPTGETGGSPRLSPPPPPDAR